MQTSTNYSEEKPKLNPVLSEVLKILDLDEGALQLAEEKKGFQATFDEIVRKYNDNKKVALLALIQDSTHYYSLDSKLQQDLSVLQEMVKALMREGGNFLDISAFIEKYSKGNKKLEKQLLKFYESNIMVSETFIRDDFSKDIAALKKSHKELFDILLSKKIISGKGKKIEINSDFIEQVLVSIGEVKDYNSLSKEDQTQAKLHIILGFIGYNISNISAENEFIFQSILSLVEHRENQKNLKEKTKDQETDIENEKKSDTGDQTGGKKQSRSSEEKSENTALEDTLDYCYPNCSYSLGGGQYTISTGNCHFQIPENEIQDFTSIALRNFIKFYTMLYDLGLNFLWDKYQHGFTILCNNTFGFDYKRGEGITESKSVSVLNLIGKNIGIPTSPPTPLLKGEGSQKLSTFNRLEEAKKQFHEIKSTGKINGEIYSDLGINSLGAVEACLIIKGKIDNQRGELNISKW